MGASLLVFHCDGFELVGDKFGLVVRNSIAAKKANAAALASLLRTLLELIERFQVLAVDDLFASERREVAVRQLIDLTDISRTQLAPARPDMDFETETKDPLNGPDFVVIRHGDLLTAKTRRHHAPYRAWNPGWVNKRMADLVRCVSYPLCALRKKHLWKRLAFRRCL